MHSATASNILNTPVLIFGGPYSNLEATRAMQARAEALQIPPQQIICTGDTIAYCAAPEDTVTLIRNWGVHVVQGNCEEAIAEDAADCGCGFETGSLCSTLSTEWFEYARKRLDRELPGQGHCGSAWRRIPQQHLRVRFRLPSTKGGTIANARRRYRHWGSLWLAIRPIDRRQSLAQCRRHRNAGQ